MSIELTMLVCSVALLIVLIVIQSTSGVLEQGLEQMAGSRDNLKPPGVFPARTKRIVDNHREGLLIFAPLVLVAATVGLSTELTVLGAQLFFYSRLAHALVYLLGVPWVRPLFYLIGMVGCLMILFALLAGG